MAHNCRSLTGFCSMKRLEVFFSPPGRMLVHRRSLPRNLSGFPQQFAGTHLYSWVHGESHFESQVSCSRTQHSVPSQGSNPDRSCRATQDNGAFSKVCAPNIK